MSRIPTATWVASGLALLAACSREAAAPSAPPPEPTAPAPVVAGAGVAYACLSGQTVSVGYPDAATAQLTYRARTYPLVLAPSARGARYTGSGLDWRTENGVDREQAVLARLEPNQGGGGAVLERCSRPLERPAPIAPSPAIAAAPCTGAQLKLSNDGGDAGMGHRVAILALQNTGPAACSLNGYPALTVLDAGGQALAGVRVEQTPGSYLRPGEAPQPVTLAPQAKAYADLAWTVIPDESRGQTTCPAARRLRLTVAGEATPLMLDQGFSPCGGRVQLGPLRALRDPQPPAQPAPAPSPAAKP